jgi:hypothetical protein
MLGKDYRLVPNGSTQAGLIGVKEILEQLKNQKMNLKKHNIFEIGKNWLEEEKR